MALNNPVFRPQDLSYDPALVGELADPRSPLEHMSLQELIAEAGRVKGKPIELVDAPDLVELLLDNNASRGQFAQLFDPDSLQKMDDAGILPAVDPTMYDPAMRGEADAPIVGGEFSRRFLTEATEGLRRGVQQEQGTVNLAEPAFPASFQRMVDKQQMLEHGVANFKPHFAGYTPPASEAVGQFALGKVAGAIQMGRAHGSDEVQQVLDALEADEIDTAPMWLFDGADAKTYTDQWWKDQQLKALGKFKEEGFTGLLPFMNATAGNTLGWLGRTRDTLNATMQSFHGWFMAQIIAGHIKNIKIPLGLGNINKSTEEWRELFAWAPEDEDMIEYLASGDDDNVRQARRAFFQENKEGWHWGLAGMAEGVLTLPTEMMIQGPKIGGPIVRSVMEKIPYSKQMASAVRSGRDKAWAKAKKNIPLIQPLTFEEKSKIVMSISNKLPVNASLKQKLRFTYDRANVLNWWEGPVDRLFAVAAWGAGNNLELMIKRFEDMMNPNVNLSNYRAIANNPGMMEPGGMVDETIKLLHGSVDAWEGGKRGGKLKPEHQAAYDDLAKNGPNIKESTRKLYGERDDNPPLPLGGLNLDKYRRPPIHGEAWSPEMLVGDAKDLIKGQLANAIGFGKGPTLNLYGLFNKRGNTNLAKFFSDQSKKQLGYVWLFGRSGFAVMNLAGGMFMLTMQQRHHMARLGSSRKWFNNISAGSGGAIRGELALGHRTRQGVGAGVQAMLGQRIYKIGTGFFQKFPVIGDRFGGPIKLPDSYLDEPGKIGKWANRLNNMPGLGGAVAKAATFIENNQNKLGQILDMEVDAKYNFHHHINELDLSERAKNMLQHIYESSNTADAAKIWDDLQIEAMWNEIAIEEQATGRVTKTYEQLMREERGRVRQYRNVEVFEGPIGVHTGDPNVKVGARTVTQGTAPAKIYIDPAVLEQKFRDKAWTKPVTLADGTRAKPLKEDAFKTYQEFQAFVLEHEFQHSRVRRLRNPKTKAYKETLAEYENRINTLALKKARQDKVISTLPDYVEEIARDVARDLTEGAYPSRIWELMPHDEPNIMVREYITQGIEDLLMEARRDGVAITPNMIREKGMQIVAEIQDRTQQMLDLTYANSPDGTVGKLAAEMRQIFVDLQAPLDDRVIRIMADLTANDDLALKLQTRALDAVAHRLSDFTGMNNPAVQKQVDSIIADFAAAQAARAKAVLTNLAIMKKRMQDIYSASSPEKRRMGPQGASADDADISLELDRFERVQKQASADAANEFEALADRWVSDEMIAAVMDNLTPPKRSFVSGPAGTRAVGAPAPEVDAAGNIQYAPTGSKNYTMRGMPGGPDQPTVTVSAWQQEALDLLEQSQRGFKSLRSRIARANSIIDEVKNSNQYKQATNSQRLAMLKTAQRQRMENIQTAFAEMSEAHPRLAIPTGKMENVLTDEVVEIVMRQAEKDGGFRPGALTDWFVDNDPGTTIRRHGKMEAERVGRAYEQIAGKWGGVRELGPSPEALAAGGTTKTTLNDIIRIRDNSILDPYERFTSRTNESLFNYVYNRGEVALQVATPYPYWSMKFAMFQARQALKYPGQFAVFAELMANWLEMTEDLPDHLKMTIHVHTLHDGTQIRLDPKILFGGPSNHAVMGLVNRGRDPEKADNAFQMIQLINMIYSGRAHPWISAAAHQAIDIVGPERVEEMFSNPEVYQEIFGRYGFIPPMEEQMASILGLNQRLATSAAAQGMIGPEGAIPEMVYEKGLTSTQRIRVGHAIADMVADGEISDTEAEQAIIDIQQGKMNPIALKGMQRYFGRDFGVQALNWGIGGFRQYTATYQKSRAINDQYRSLLSEGRVSEAKALLDENPALPVRWMINDDLATQELNVNKATYWDYSNAEREKLDHALEQTDVLDTQTRQALIDAYRENVDRKQESLNLSDEDINPDENNTPILRDEQGVPFVPNLKEKAVDTLVKSYRAMVKYEDFIDEDNVFDFESYEIYRDEWESKHIPEGMRVDFHGKLNTNISLPEAILRVFKDTYVNDYFTATEGMTPDDKEAYMEENKVPSLEALVRAVKEAYPKRNWVNKNEEIDPIMNDAAIRSKLEKVSLSIQGWLDVTARDKIERVRRSSTDSPYAFRSNSGLLVNKESLPEYSQAYVDMSRFQSSKSLRDEFDNRIDKLTEEFQQALGRLKPGEFAVGKDDRIRELYMGANGTSGHIGRIRNLKQQAVNQGLITPWTPLADKWFGGEKEYGRDDAMREMRALFYKVQPSSFTSDDGINWNAFNEARDQAFTEALDLGFPYNITPAEFQSDLDRNKVPSEAAWIYWQETYIGPALEARHALKDKFGNVTAAHHSAVAARFSKVSTVEDILPQILERFPHLSKEDFGTILNEELPNFAEYWAARGYNTPVGGMGRTSRSYYSDPFGTPRLDAYMQENPDVRLPTSLL